MRTSYLLASLGFAALIATPAAAQQQQPTSQQQQMQNEADKGVKTQNSGESGFVADQNKPGAAARPPGRPENSTTGSAGQMDQSNTGKMNEKSR